LYVLKSAIALRYAYYTTLPKCQREVKNIVFAYFAILTWLWYDGAFNRVFWA